VEARALIVALVLAAAALSGCGGSGEDEAGAAAMEAHQVDRRSAVEAAVERGALPPVVMQMFRADNSIDISIIDGPNRYDDVIRTRDYGRGGPKLAWDLDQDGTISADEREITEQELYDATLGLESPKSAAARVADRRAHIDKLVRDGNLPPVARKLISADGAMDLDFIAGPKYAGDVVRTSADGSSGRKLVWDLNRNGRIDRSERTITEQELYAATTW
jgi:hypothetical protein